MNESMENLCESGSETEELPYFIAPSSPHCEEDTPSPTSEFRASVEKILKPFENEPKQSLLTSIFSSSKSRDRAQKRKCIVFNVVEKRCASGMKLTRAVWLMQPSRWRSRSSHNHVTMISFGLIATKIY